MESNKLIFGAAVVIVAVVIVYMMLSTDTVKKSLKIPKCNDANTAAACVK